mmetsp:Transcript_22674/g.54271  ORF Transcript_22674/g.54271 Transcript_22674/m.54271 type:complete len:287 (-) Transcript_22674:582-1442(-)
MWRTRRSPAWTEKSRASSSSSSSSTRSHPPAGRRSSRSSGRRSLPPSRTPRTRTCPTRPRPRGRRCSSCTEGGSRLPRGRSGSKRGRARASRSPLSFPTAARASSTSARAKSSATPTTSCCRGSPRCTCTGRRPQRRPAPTSRAPRTTPSSGWQACSTGRRRTCSDSGPAPLCPGGPTAGPTCPLLAAHLRVCIPDPVGPLHGCSRGFLLGWRRWWWAWNRTSVHSLQQGLPKGSNRSSGWMLAKPPKMLVPQTQEGGPRPSQRGGTFETPYPPLVHETLPLANVV